MDSAGRLLDLTRKGDVVAVVGCGGKTTFIESLAQELRQKKVLISPTTQILPPAAADVTLRATLPDCENHRAARGIQCLGIRSEATGKLGALPPGLLAELVGEYDLALLEADGSRGLPCKGWREGEPVVPDFCTHTVGIVTMDAVGRPADERAVLRLPEFLRLTGLRAGEPVTLRALTDMVCAAQGIFRHSAGKRYLFVNRVEDWRSGAAAMAWLGEIKRRYPRLFSGLAYGSAKRNTWREV